MSKSSGTLGNGLTNYRWVLEGHEVGELTIRLLLASEGKTQVAQEHVFSKQAEDCNLEMQLLMKDQSGKDQTHALDAKLSFMFKGLKEIKATSNNVFPTTANGTYDVNSALDHIGQIYTNGTKLFYYKGIWHGDLTYQDSLEGMTNATKEGATFVFVTLDWKAVGDTRIKNREAEFDLSPEISRMLELSGQNEEEFLSDVHETLSRVAGIPELQWEKFATSPNPSADLIEGKPLSLVLLWDAPVSENLKGFEGFNFLTERSPKPHEIQKAMGLSIKRGYVSLIQPEYIKKFKLDVNEKEKLLRGSVEFEAPELYSGKVNFAATFNRGRLRIVEFSLPVDGIAIGLNNKGLWDYKDRNDPIESGQSLKTSSGPQAKQDAVIVKVNKSYNGVCSMKSADPKSPVANMTDFPIYSQKDFEEFIKRIPENNDPLLKKPRIDFKQNMALVMMNPDSITVMPRVRSIREDTETLWIDITQSETPAGEVVPQGMGTYTVAIIPFSGDFKNTNFSKGISSTTSQIDIPATSDESAKVSNPDSKLELTSDVMKNFIRSRQHLVNFEKELITTISRDAGIPKEQWEKIGRGFGAEAIEGTPLTKLLLISPSADDSKTHQKTTLVEFRMLSTGTPKPAELHKSVASSQLDGFVSLIQPEYITKVTLDFDRQAEEFKGTVWFEKTDFYAGHVNFTFYYHVDQMKVKEFELPERGVKLVRDSQLWKLQKLIED